MGKNFFLTCHTICVWLLDVSRAVLQATALDPSSVSRLYIGGVAGVESPAEQEEAVMKCRVLGARYGIPYTANFYALHGFFDMHKSIPVCVCN